MAHAPEIMFAILLLSLALYMALDGFDLGVGTLTLIERDPEHKHEMMESIATVWDGNESWLVLAAAVLFAGFPAAFGVILPALYIPLIVMIAALTFRGVAFEFQAQHEGYDRCWGLSFAAGSLVAAFSQGVALGALLQGISISGGDFTGGPLDFLSPFSLLCGVLITALYALSGAGWLAAKSTGDLLESSRRRGRALALVCAVLIPATSAAALAASPPVAALLDGASGTRLALVGLSFAAAMATLAGTYALLGRRDDWSPLALGCAVTVAALAFAVAAVYPDLVPGQLTLHEAAAPESSAWLLLAFSLPLVPVTIAYNAFAYWVFRGKTHSPEGEQTSH